MPFAVVVEKDWDVRITAVEMVPEILALAVENSKGQDRLQIIGRDVLTEPPGGSYDYVIASLFLHHIPPASQAKTLKRLDGMARRGMILSDLERSQSGYWSVTALSRLIGNRIVRNDGPLSVRRAFRPKELQSLAAEAGLPYLKASREPFFRMSLAGEKP